jgi:hypothetical protein
LPVGLLPFFERFDRIYLWLDADEVGQNAVEKFSKVRTFFKLLETGAPQDFSNKLAS